VLRAGGLLVFSTGHPLFDYLHYKLDHYFGVQAVGDLWKGFGGDPVYVPTYYQPLGTITGALAQAGFVIERLVEPLPTDEFKQADPEHYAELMRFPVFMCIRARKIAPEPRIP
jgi:hypothetical protein